MAKIPLIVGFGGINSAGRSSFFQSFKRIVHDNLEPTSSQESFLELAQMMGLASYEDNSWIDLSTNKKVSETALVEKYKSEIIDGTLIRKIEDNFFDTNKIQTKKKLSLSNQAFSNKIKIAKNQVKDSDILNRLGSETEDGFIELDLNEVENVLISDYKKLGVSAAGQLPRGFDIGKTYKSRHHPRGLQLAVYGASDAIDSLGIPWEVIRERVSPDLIGVYAGSGMGQMDDFGAGGYARASSLGIRPTTKQMPFSFAEMTADFINAYLIGSLGYTGASVGACATYLYNLDHAIKDIQSGRRRIAIVGNAEAPILPEIIEAYRVMGALAEDQQLSEILGKPVNEAALYKKACRPFSDNCGFTIAESSQFVVLFDHELALEFGANIYGAVPSVFVNADGYKKSISKPGAGNYLTMAKAAASAKAILGEQVLRQNTFVSAHGTGTPQNRVTESHVINETAKAFGINDWVVSAIKSYVGHSIGPAAGDQILFSLGTWQEGLIPGIRTIDSVAEDVNDSNLDILVNHKQTSTDFYKAAFINSKGFGGNNATALILSPDYIKNFIQGKTSGSEWNEYLSKNEKVSEEAQTYNQEKIKGHVSPTYKTSEHILDEQDIEINDDSMKIQGYPEFSITQRNVLEDE